ncbi:hypothetical protein [Candidatus Ichthyocystis sparus]|nr:hypothetical protein [Candidatus Ichthyocystis sparus]
MKDEEQKHAVAQEAKEEDTITLHTATATRGRRDPGSNQLYRKRTRT